MTPLDLLILALFAWYTAYVLIRTSGPFKLFATIRSITLAGGLLECLYCLTPWMGAIGYLIYVHTPYQWIVYLGAIAGLAMMGHRWTGGDHA